MTSKQELLDSIQPGMKLTKNFFMRIYGYELTYPGYAAQALAELERIGCSRAREYYQRFVGEYEKEHDETMKNVAAWYIKQETKKRGSDSAWAMQQEKKQTRDASWSPLSGVLHYH